MCGTVTAVILADDYLQATFNPSFEALSRKHFGEDEAGNPHNIHRRMLTRAPEKGPFAKLKEWGAREAWDTVADDGYLRESGEDEWR